VQPAHQDEADKQADRREGSKEIEVVLRISGIKALFLKTHR